jgi:hypothetical protein
LKNCSFKSDIDKKVIRELDYLFELSVMYQKVSSKYGQYHFYHPKVWEKFFYYHVMGLGYKPVKLLKWAGLIIFLSFLLYFAFFNELVNQHFDREYSKPIDKLEFGAISLLNCFYFSCIMFFSLKIKTTDILLFPKWGKCLIISEKVFGILTYVFLIFGFEFWKSETVGPIMQMLKIFI